MKQIGTIVNQIVPEKPLSEGQGQSLTIKDDPEGRKRLGEIIGVFYNGLKTYGKAPETLEDAVMLFNLILSDYPVSKIMEAMKYYAKNYSDFPAPADIARIIDRGNKPPLERSVYVSISKKDAESRTSDEWQYMREYENYMVNG